MNDAGYTPKRLTEEWASLILRATSSGIGRAPLIETMLEVALSEYRELYGDDLLGNYLRDLLIRLDQPVTPREAAEHLIIGEEEEADSPADRRSDLL